MKDIQNLNAEIHTIAFSLSNTLRSTKYNTTPALHVFYGFQSRCCGSNDGDFVVFTVHSTTLF
jgi:hypothetical protein